MHDRPPGFTVAVVDDDRRILDSLEALLASADFGVRAFESATAMLDSGCLAEIDCLISDVGMPGMGGYELLKIARAMRPGLPVILISGRADSIARAAGPEGRHYRLFTKPFNGEELLAAVVGALLKSGASGLRP